MAVYSGPRGSNFLTYANACAVVSPAAFKAAQIPHIALRYGVSLVYAFKRRDVILKNLWVFEVFTCFYFVFGFSIELCDWWMVRQRP